MRRKLWDELGIRKASFENINKELYLNHLYLKSSRQQVLNITVNLKPNFYLTRRTNMSLIKTVNSFREFCKDDFI